MRTRGFAVQQPSGRMVWVKHRSGSRFCWSSQGFISSSARRDLTQPGSGHTPCRWPFRLQQTLPSSSIISLLPAAYIHLDVIRLDHLAARSAPLYAL
ncbi:hypothetical protein BDN72DRAFT_102509 [Pluteus cervinus]|uniref:Uncharacterized protein n=1 Tax=Pluteus cervinus TaxID=181527 RepID=A0ACD3B8J6_9AGAR|nr:hypothetical protein BDN72DRAFT_102509 [Pluteus cervinus]